MEKVELVSKRKKGDLLIIRDTNDYKELRKSFRKTITFDNFIRTISSELKVKLPETDVMSWLEYLLSQAKKKKGTKKLKKLFAKKVAIADELRDFFEEIRGLVILLSR